MRIGLPSTATKIDNIVRQAQQAEAEGFSSLWFTGAVGGDPLAALAVAGRATSTIELGTAILQTYACHPVLMAARATAVPSTIGTAGRFTLGIGPSHAPVIENVFGLPYDHPGRHTEEYVQVLAPLLAGESVAFRGDDIQAAAGPVPPFDDQPIPMLLAALGPRLLRVAGQHTAGTIPWMANAVAIETHIAPLINRAAADAGRPAPRIVAGLPIAVHDDVAEARSVAVTHFGLYGTLPNYQRIFEHGGVAGPAEAAIVGDEQSVTGQIEALFESGATELWLAPFPVGDDRSASRTRTCELLKTLVGS